MASGVLAIIGGILALAGQLLAEYFKGAPERKRQADAITQRDLTELERGMDAVDGVQRDQPVPPGSPPGV